MPRKTTDRGLEADLDEDFNFDLLADVRRRLELVEKRDAADRNAERIHREAKKLSDGDDDLDDDPVIARGEQVLAKAQDAFHRIGNPDDVLQRAMKVMPNAVDVGVVQGFLSVGTRESFVKALSLVTEQENRNERAHAETAVNGMLNDFDHAEDAQSLRDEVTELRQTVATLTGRLVQLESRPMSVPQQEVVAKGYQQPTSRSSTAKNDAASLLQRGQGVIDSVSTIGVLSSLINDGRLSEARSMVEAAELEHEAKVKAAERKRLR